MDSWQLAILSIVAIVIIAVVVYQAANRKKDGKEDSGAK